MNTCETYSPINEALLWRFFAGETSSDEAQQLAQWIKNDEAHKADFQRVKELYYSTKNAPKRAQFDSKEAFAQFEQKTQHRAQISWFRPWMAVAAVIALLFCGGFMILNTKSTNTLNEINYSYSPNKNNYTLPDNSTIQLNRRSSLQYQTSVENKRVAVLLGEAFFDIQHNATKPFEVLTNNLKIKVLGTSFNINAQNPDSIIVSVASGRVLLVSLLDSSKTAILTAGQSARFVNNVISPISNNSNNALAWKKHILNFDATPLDEVSKTLSSYFDTTIQIKSTEKDQQLSVQLTEPKLDSVLQLLQVMYHLKTIKKDNKILLLDQDKY